MTAVPWAHLLEMAIHRVLVERDQQIELVAHVRHGIDTRPYGQQRVTTPDDRLIGVVRIQVQPSADEDPCKYVSRGGNTLSCSPADRDRESPIHSQPPGRFSQRLLAHDFNAGSDKPIK